MCAVTQEAQTCWDFDMFKLEDATRGHPLSCLAYFIFQVSATSHCPDMQVVCL